MHLQQVALCSDVERGSLLADFLTSKSVYIYEAAALSFNLDDLASRRFFFSFFSLYIDDGPCTFR